MSNNYKNKINEKTRALERESNITLISTSVVIFSFILLLFVQNQVSVNVVAAQSFLLFVEIAYALLALATCVIALVKKKFFLFEYTAFFLIMALGYYIIKNGALGIIDPFYEFGDPIPATRSSFEMFLINILQTKYVIVALWGINVLYAILTITLHTVKYTKIKNKHKKAQSAKQ